MNVFELFGKIAIDSSGAEKGINNTVKHASNAEDKLSKTFKKIGGMVAAAFSVRAIVDFGKQCTEAYASIAAEESAFAQIMGDYAGTAQAKLNAVSDATGVSATRMTGAMTSLTAKFKGLGYDVEDATTLAADGLLIASDAAAFWDMSLDESMSHLNSFINGSYEGGEAIGLFANDTQMAAYAVKEGIVASTKEWAALDEATKQATRLDFAKKMMADSGATGQAAKEASSYANVMANLKESWRQFQGVVGKPILEKIVLPAMQKLNDFLPKLTEGVQNGIVWLEEGFDKIKGYFDEVFTEDGINLDALPNALTNMFRDLGRSVGGLLSNFGQKLKNGWENTIWPMTQRAFKATFGIDVPDWSEIESIVTTWWDGGNGIAQAIASVCNWTLNLFGAPAEVSAEDVKNVLGTWWNNTVNFVQDACAWVLKLFTNPKETAEEVGSAISSWWSGIVGAVQDACAWVLNVFQSPPDISAEDVENILDSWWTKAVTFVQDACSWVLNLFGAPDEVTADDVASTLSAWWNNTVGFVQDACAWVLNLFTHPTSDQQKIIDAISGWWEAACAVVVGACNWALHLFGAPDDVTLQDVEDVLSGWWTKTKALVQTACTWVLSLFGMPSENGETIKEKISTWWSGIWEEIGENLCTITSFFKTPDGVVKQIKEWWSGITSQISLSISAIWDGITGAGGSPPQSTGGSAYTFGGGAMNAFMNDFSFDDALGDKIPGFATGLDYVPRDNYLARLHQGEAVLTRNEADAWRGGYGTGRMEAVLAQMADLLRDIARNTGAETNVVLETGTLVGALTPRINQRLGNLNRLNARG